MIPLSEAWRRVVVDAVDRLRTAVASATAPRAWEWWGHDDWTGSALPEDA